MRLSQICTIATTMLLLGGLASGADAKTKVKASGGAAGPALGGGTGATGSGATGSTGTTSSTGSTDPIAPLTALAPIVLAHDQSPTAVYDGPVFELTPAGLVAYVPASTTGTATPVTVAGGTTVAASSSTDTNGPLSTTLPLLEVPGSTAEMVKVGDVELAAAPEDAPAAVQEVIWAGNRLIGLPYLWGGGHRSFFSPRGYDCSGTVSFALHGGALLSSPLDSGQFMHWGARGQGQWMTILTNPGHAYIDVAGLRLDTSAENDPSDLQGPRWRPLRPANAGFVKRHPLGF